MKVLVTGAAGAIGYHLSMALLARGDRVTMVDNFCRGPKDRFIKELALRPKARFLTLDLAQQRVYPKLGSGYDRVYHLAAINGTKNFYERPHEVLRADLLGTIFLLDWFVKSKSKKILFSSTSETYGGGSVPIPTPESVPLIVADPFNPRWSYGGSKIAGELLFINYARRFKFPFSIIRYNNVYGPRAGQDHVIPAFLMRIIKRDNPFPIHGADCTRTFCYVDDAVAATILVMERHKAGGRIVHIGSDLEGEVLIRDLARMMFDLFDFHPKVAEHPAPDGSPKRRQPMLDVLCKELGFRPKVRLQEGLRISYEWYKSNADRPASPASRL